MDWRGGWGKEEEEGEGGEEKGAEREIIFKKRKKAECGGEEGRGATATTVQKFKQLCLALLANRRLHQSKRLESRKISQGSPSNMSLLLSGNLFNNYHILPSGDLIFFIFPLLASLAGRLPYFSLGGQGRASTAPRPLNPTFRGFFFSLSLAFFF